ncbi:MAG: hypothetical protein ACHQNA_12670, partial [Acidimicrobiales bacterium]
LKIEHARFAGGLHLAGFDTGVISSRRRLSVETPAVAQVASTGPPPASASIVACEVGTPAQASPRDH